VLDLNGQVITRQHVLQLLPIMGLTAEQEERLLALPYPVDFDVAAAAFESVGVDMDTLTDRMGGSP
jgi:S-adenosylhomocysteine hydrolase